MALEVRKEQVVLVGTIVVLGLFVWNTGSDSGGGTTRTRGRASRQDDSAAVFTSYPAPDIGLAMPEAREHGESRDVFSPPRDTRPLPPLELAAPPLPVLSALRPPPEPPLAPLVYGTYLRADPTPTHVPGLFVAEAADEEQPLETAQAEPEQSMLEQLQALGLATEDEQLSPEQRAARIESWKQLYDWIRINDGAPLFGQIRNEDRFGLTSRRGEAILFVEVLPEEAGRERHPGMAPAPIARERILDFGFADTASNHIQIKRAEFDRPVTPSVYADLIAFGRECMRLRLEAREALQVAEEMFKKAIAFDPGDPLPVVFLARSYEAGFRFEESYQTYLDLLQRFPHRAEVHAGLGLLEQRMRLFESAEERLRRAVSIERGNYLVRWALGRFLYERGKYDEAVLNLREAHRFEPKEPALASDRTQIRTELGEALMATGELDEALALFDRALSADAANQVAQAGRLGALQLGAGGNGTEAAEVELESDSGFELLIARAMIQLEAGEAVPARDSLLLAAETDPLRAHVAWRALSWLSEVSGYPEEALRWIEEAHLADPTDAWTLYQRGRLLAARDDPEGARDSFMGALDRELDFVDALIALGRLSFGDGDHSDAELFFERALELDGARPEVHALRGINRLALNDVRGAEESFEAALALEDTQPLALTGMAWVAYRRGDSDRAITRFAELDDRRRALPESDPYRLFAVAQMARVSDHEEKEIWSDRFERRQLKNGWQRDEAAGPEVFLEEGQLVVRGTFKQNGVTRFWRELAAPDFVSIEMNVTVQTDNNARVGLFVAKERRRGAGVTDVQGMLSAGREKDGTLAVVMMDTTQSDLPWEDVPDLPGIGGAWWPAGRSVRIRLERVGEGSDAYGRISVDGIIVREGFSVQRLSTSSSTLKLGLFVEGQTGLPGHVVVDDVEMVYRVKS